MFYTLLVFCTAVEVTVSDQLFKKNYNYECSGSGLIITKSLFYRIKDHAIIAKCLEKTLSLSNCGFFECQGQPVSCEISEFSMKFCCVSKCEGPTTLVASESVDIGNIQIDSSQGGFDITLDRGIKVAISYVNITQITVGIPLRLDVPSGNVDVRNLLFASNNVDVLIQDDSKTTSLGDAEHSYDRIKVTGSCKRLLKVKDSAQHIITFTNVGIFADSITKLVTGRNARIWLRYCNFSASESYIDEVQGDCTLLSPKYEQDETAVLLPGVPPQQCWVLMSANSTNKLYIFLASLSVAAMLTIICVVLWRCCHNRDTASMPIMYV